MQYPTFTRDSLSAVLLAIGKTALNNEEALIESRATPYGPTMEDVALMALEVFAWEEGERPKGGEYGRESAQATIRKMQRLLDAMASAIENDREVHWQEEA